MDVERIGRVLKQDPFDEPFDCGLKFHCPPNSWCGGSGCDGASVTALVPRRAWPGRGETDRGAAALVPAGPVVDRPSVCRSEALVPAGPVVDRPSVCRFGKEGVIWHKCDRP